MKILKFGSDSCGLCHRMKSFDEQVIREFGYEYEYLKKGTFGYEEAADIREEIKQFHGGPIRFPLYAFVENGTVMRVVRGACDKGTFRKRMAPRAEETRTLWEIDSYMHPTEGIQVYEVDQGYIEVGGPDFQFPKELSQADKDAGWQLRKGNKRIDKVHVIYWITADGPVPHKPSGTMNEEEIAYNCHLWDLVMYREVPDGGGGGDGGGTGGGGGGTSDPSCPSGFEYNGSKCVPKDPCEGVSCSNHQECKNGKCVDRCPDPCKVWKDGGCRDINTPSGWKPNCPSYSCPTGVIGMYFTNGIYGFSFDRTVIKNISAVAPGDKNEKKIIIEFKKGGCDPDKICQSLCVASGSTAAGNTIASQPSINCKKLSDYVFEVTFTGEWYNNCFDISRMSGQGSSTRVGQPRDACQLTGSIIHGGEFKNWIEFTGSDGHFLKLDLPKGSYNFGEHIEPLHPGVTYRYQLFSDCRNAGDGQVNAACGWGQKVENDGRSLMCEDAIHSQKPGVIDFQDLQIHLDPGHGIWHPDGEISATGSIDVPDNCKPAPPPSDPCDGVVCPPGQICVNGVCVDGCGNQCPAGTICVNGVCTYDKTSGNFIPGTLKYECCPDCQDSPPPTGDSGDNSLTGCDNRPDPDVVPGTNTRSTVYLYDRLNHTYKFCCPMQVDVTWLLPFDAIPPVFQRYITTVASVRAAAQLIDNPQLFQLLKDRENILRMECNNYELEQGDLNYLNQPDHSMYVSYQTSQTLNR